MRKRGPRHVDARTGAPPTVRQTVILLAARDGLAWLVGMLPGAALPRPPDPELMRGLRQLHEQHRDDPAALDAAIADLHRERHTSPPNVVRPLLIRTASVALMTRCPVPFLAQRRTVPDLLAGTRLQRRRG